MDLVRQVANCNEWKENSDRLLGQQSDFDHQPTVDLLRRWWFELELELEAEVSGFAYIPKRIDSRTAV